jgi:hypothetical protein
MQDRDWRSFEDHEWKAKLGQTPKGVTTAGVKGDALQSVELPVLWIQSTSAAEQALRPGPRPSSRRDCSPAGHLRVSRRHTSDSSRIPTSTHLRSPRAWTSPLNSFPRRISRKVAPILSGRENREQGQDLVLDLAGVVDRPDAPWLNHCLLEVATVRRPAAGRSRCLFLDTFEQCVDFSPEGSPGLALDFG